ncbi:MAG: serine/threonine-protein kinase RsbW [Gaiellales bacterium]|nr:serine/threonine-protein kinase RsbW [Gaiellales bacterium]
MLPRLSLVLPAAPEGVPQARAAVTELCERLGVEADQADGIRLAVTEACTNCVLHSHPDGDGDATFVLDAHVDDGALVIVVRDFGGGLLRAPVGSGGLGLGMHLIEQLSESSQVSSRPGGGTRVLMRFTVLPEGAAVPDIPNSLRLNHAEVDAVRGLQTGTNRIAADDPVWGALRDAGLVQRKGTGIAVWSLTMRGRLYRTE